MPSIVIVEKNGDLKTQEYKSVNTDDLYKKCLLKKSEGFSKVAEWTYSKKGENMITVELWARNDGQASQENKYDFPPPADNELFFGNCALLSRDSSMNIVDLTVEKWNKIYEHLFGGFETLADNEDEDEDEEDELDNVPSSMKTKDGYLKDGFIIEDALEDGDGGEGVNSDETVSDSDHDENESENDETASSDDNNDDNESDNGSARSSELTSEEYEYSDSEEDTKNGV